MMAVPSSFSLRRSFRMPSAVSPSRLPVGSSARMAWGRFSRARAMAMRCCSPPESWLMRHLVGLRAHAYVFQDLLDTGVDGGAVLPARGAEDELEVRFHGTVHQQLEILEHDAQAPAQHRYVFCTDVAEVEPTDGSFSLGEPVFGRHRPDDGGLARPHLPDDVHEIARVDGHVEAVDDDAVPAQDVCAAELDNGFHCVFGLDYTKIIRKIRKFVK